MAKFTNLPLKFVTAKELGDPLISQALNFRFVSFLARLSKELKLEFLDVALIADQLLREAEIAQE